MREMEIHQSQGWQVQLMHFLLFNLYYRAAGEAAVLVSHSLVNVSYSDECSSPFRAKLALLTNSSTKFDKKMTIEQGTLYLHEHDGVMLHRGTRQHHSSRVHLCHGKARPRPRQDKYTARGGTRRRLRIVEEKIMTRQEVGGGRARTEKKKKKNGT